MDRIMLRRTSSQFDHYTVRRRVLTLVRKAIGFAIFVSGFAVITVHLLRRLADS
jgi:hypothetical protein